MIRKTKQKPFRATNIFIRREMAAARAMMHKRVTYQAVGATQFSFKTSDRAEYAWYDRVNYAAALGQKRGLLPINLSAWESKGGSTVSNGRALVLFFPPEGEIVEVEIEWLDWEPSEPIEHFDDELEGVFA